MRECFCFGSEAVNASGEAVRGLVKSRRNEFCALFHARELKLRCNYFISEKKCFRI